MYGNQYRQHNKIIGNLFTKHEEFLNEINAFVFEILRINYSHKIYEHRQKT